MKKLLLPIDGSDASQRSIAYILEDFNGYSDAPEIHLLNIQSPLPSGVTQFFSRDDVRQDHLEEGGKELAKARAKLDKAGRKYLHSIVIGQPAEAVARYAKAKKIDQIVLGTRRLTAVSGILLGSVTTKIISATNTPVLLLK